MGVRTHPTCTLLVKEKGSDDEPLNCTVNFMTARKQELTSLIDILSFKERVKAFLSNETISYCMVHKGSILD